VTHLQKIVEYAQSMSHRARRPEHEHWRYGSFYEVVLAHGRVFEPAPLPDTVYPALPGHCFQVAAILSDLHGMAYVEGLALLPDAQTVIEHAWCTTWLGQVVDPSLGGNTAAAYLGIAFTLQFRHQAVARTGNRWPVLLADQDGGRSPTRDILEHGLPDAATVPLVGTPLASPVQPASTNPPSTPDPRAWLGFTATGAYDGPWPATLGAPPPGEETRNFTPARPH
jgi:hypothetical protein